MQLREKKRKLGFVYVDNRSKLWTYEYLIHMKPYRSSALDSRYMYNHAINIILKNFTPI